MTAPELVDQGIRAYARGDHREAERCWAAALVADPGNASAQAYLTSLAAERSRLSAAGPRTIPLPPPSAAPPRPARAAFPGAGPVPLPAVSPPAWARPPVAAPPVHQGAPPLVAPAPAEAPLALAEPPAAAPAGRTTLPDFAPSPWDQGPARAPAVILGDGDGLDLSTVEEKSGLHPLVPEPPPPAAPAPRQRPRSDVEVWMDGARELSALGDFSGSLEMIERILKVDPGHAEARQYLNQNEATLIDMYESKLGPPDGIPRLAIKPEEVMWLNLDHRAGFLLAQIDGTVTYEDLFALSGVPRLDTARILASLLQEGVIRTT